MDEQKRTIPHKPIAIFHQEVPLNPDGMKWIASTIVVHPAGRSVLIQKRLKTGEWEFPGGKVEPGEDYRNGAVREVKEETGLDVEIERYICSVIVGRLDSIFVCQFYLATMVDEDQEIVIDHNAVEEVRWATENASRGLNWLPGTVAAWTSIFSAVRAFRAGKTRRKKK